MVHVSFICTGNICRSPMAEKMLAHACYERGWDVTVSSAGLHDYHHGQDMDPRTRSELLAHNIDMPHSASKMTAYHVGADLVIAMDFSHQLALSRADVPPERLVMMRSFDPQPDSLEVEDPYYGDARDFVRTYSELAAALPGLLDRVSQLLHANN